MSSVLGKALVLLTGEEYNIKAPRLPKLGLPGKRKLKPLTERELIKLESEIGASLFGALPKGHRREFFCLDARTWIWYEEWFDAQHKHRTATTRYEIQDKGILKVMEGARYAYLEGQELENLIAAIHMYYERVSRELYRVDPDTGEYLDAPA